MQNMGLVSKIADIAWLERIAYHVSALTCDIKLLTSSQKSQPLLITRGQRKGQVGRNHIFMKLTVIIQQY